MEGEVKVDFTDPSGGEAIEEEGKDEENSKKGALLLPAEGVPLCSARAFPLPD